MGGAQSTQEQTTQRRHIRHTCNQQLKDISTDSLKAYCDVIGAQSDENRETMIESIIESLLKNARTKMLDRENIYNQITSILEQVTRKNSKSCFSDKGDNSLSSAIRLMNRLGYGAEGVVMEGFIVPVSELSAVKFTKTSKKFISSLISKKIKWYQVPHDSKGRTLAEILNGRMINEILKLKAAPSLVWFYDWFLCDLCKETIKIVKSQGKPTGQTKPDPGPCIISSWEKELGNVKQLSKRMGELHSKVMIFQIIWALFCLDKYWGMDHRDSELRNIFYTVQEPGGYSEYITENNVHYYLPVIEYSFYLGDYGFAWSPRYYGTNKGNISTKGGFKKRDLEGNDLPQLSHPYNNEEFRFKNPKSLHMFLTSIQKIDYTSVPLKELSSKILETIPDPEGRGKRVGMNYEGILNDFFSEYKTKPPGQQQFQKYEMVNFSENPDEMYIRIAKQISEGK